MGDFKTVILYTLRTGRIPRFNGVYLRRLQIVQGSINPIPSGLFLIRERAWGGGKLHPPLDQPRYSANDFCSCYKSMPSQFWVIIFIFEGSRAKIVSIPTFIVCKIEKTFLALTSTSLRFR